MVTRLVPGQTATVLQLPASQGRSGTKVEQTREAQN